MFTENIREKFLQYYPDEDLKKWFDPLVLNYTQPGQGETPPAAPLSVRFPHRFFADWWSANHKDKFERALRTCLGRQPEINYSYSFSGTARLRHPALVKPSEDSAPPDFTPAETPEAEARQSFDNFIYNRKNQFPFAAAKKFAEGGSHKLFILFGPSGSGKSHLLQAIYKEAKKNVPEKFILLSKISELETFFTKAFKNGQSILSYLRNFKYILIDDLDMAESSPTLQEQLGLLIECVEENRLNMAFTLRHKPGALSLVNEKLRSLLEAGLVIELKRPDLDVRRQYVDYTAAKLNLKLKKDDALALARMYGGFRQIHGALLKVSSFQVLSTQAAEAKLADVLQTSFSEGRKRLTPDQIIGSVAEYFKIAPADITGKKRRQNIVLARHLSMYLCRDLLGAQFGHIGACFSDREHSSVLYSVNKINRLIKNDQDTHNLVTEMKNIIMK